MRARQESDEGDREGGRAAKAAEGRRALTLGSDGSVIQVGARTSMSSFSFVSLLSLSASQRLSGYVAFLPSLRSRSPDSGLPWLSANGDGKLRLARGAPQLHFAPRRR